MRMAGQVDLSVCLKDGGSRGGFESTCVKDGAEVAQMGGRLLVEMSS